MLPKGGIQCTYWNKTDICYRVTLMALSRIVPLPHVFALYILPLRTIAGQMPCILPVIVQSFLRATCAQSL